jgi:uncharacterized protein (TIRG00374 family)
MNKKWQKFFKFIVTITLVYFLLSKIDWVEVYGYLSNVKIVFIILFVVLYLIGILISARKWQLLAEFSDFKQAYVFYVRAYLTGTFLNNFFPSFIGGDAYRIHTLGKENKQFKDSSVTVLVDRISGLIGIIILAVIFGLLNYDNIFKSRLIFLLVIFMVTSIVFIGLGILFFETDFVKKWFSYLPKKVNKYLNNLGRFRKKEIFFQTINYSFLFIFIGIALTNYALFMSFRIEISFFNFLSVAFLSNIIATIPISVGNIGVKEWAYVFLFGIFGVESSAVVTVVLASRFLQMIISLVAVPFYLQNKNNLIINKKLNK